MTNLPVTGSFQVTAIYGQQGKYWKNGHKGIDLVAADRRIYCSCSGVVRKVAYDDGGWGQYISVEGDEGYRHIFCHLVKGSQKVKVGQRVTPLTVLGEMGATGNVTGIHLHYQLQKGDRIVDPTLYLGIPNKKGKYHSKNYSIEEVKQVAYKDAKKIPGWAKSAVEMMKKRGWMVGDAAGNFRPDDPVTRAELAVALSKIKE